jgi:hypothetical protein
LAYDEVEVGQLRVNQANDRHGEVGSEDLAMAELFRLHDAQMQNLAADIATVGAVYDPPLVMPGDDVFVVFDGNRRVTCLKLLLDPSRAYVRALTNAATCFHSATTPTRHSADGQPCSYLAAGAMMRECPILTVAAVGGN